MSRIAGLIRWAVGLAVVGAIVWLPAACGRRQPGEIAAVSDTTDLSALRAKVFSLIGEPTCKDASECRTIAYGSKPCGGPWRYLVYSVSVTDSAQLETAVGQYNAREGELNRLYARTSDCSLVSRPRLQAVNGRCAIAP